MLTFKIKAHLTIPGRQVVELWDGEKFLGTITASNECGMRVFSKHDKKVSRPDEMVVVVEFIS